MSSGDGVIHTIARLALADGGPARTVPALCRSLVETGIHVEIVTGTVDLDPGVPVRVSGVKEKWGRIQPRAAPFRELLARRLARTNVRILHDNGIWLWSNHAAARVSAKARVSRIVSPHGMLSEWAISHRGWKKRIAWRAFQRRDLESADALHATSDLEGEEFRAAGLRAPIAVVPNGVELPPEPPRPTVPDRVRRLLFLSRIHPKKGLEALVDAWGLARPPGWELVIAGPDERGHRAVIEERAAALGPRSAIRFHDPVPDARKWDLYRTADVFVLPTLSENFGVVVAEALGSGVPVITTRAAPWSALLDHRCGWWIELGPEPLAAAIREAASIDDEERRVMGARGRALVEESFGWPAIARRMLAVYRWLAGEAAAPEWVRTG